MNYEVLEALGQIAQEKNVDKALVIETLEIGLLSATKRRFGTSDNVEVNIDANSGNIEVFATKSVVKDDEVEDPALQIGLTAAREIEPGVKVNTEVREMLRFADFGRNAIQSTKQILIQRVREAEREKIYEDYQTRIGEIISGTVQQISHGDILINLGRTEAVIPLKEQIRKERYRQGDPIRAYLVNVLRTSKGPQVVLSRTHPQFLVKLFQFEVPEIYEGIIEIKAVAREPGERAKIAVYSNDARIDPVGACVGMKGSRVQAVVRELSNERIDIVPWSDDEAIFLSRSLSPATVNRVVVDRNKTTMTAIVEDDQLSLAIGKSGQNARLAAQLTGWKVDIITETRFQEMQLEKEATFVPLSEVAGVGKVMLDRLEAAGILSANDLVDVSLIRLLEVPGIGESTGEKIQSAAEEIVNVKVQAYREELEAQRAEEAARLAEAEAARLAEEEAARIAEEEAAAAETVAAPDEDGNEPMADEEMELSQDGAAVQPTASEDNQVGGPSEDEGR
ncbi:MAG: transcription termination factor NusA [Gemmatimonadota bacterium]|nr:transcription termination factor NusA [Gemmatimonadota bacterium]